MPAPNIEPNPPLPRRDALLVLAALTGPFAFALNELASYSLAPTACAAGTKWMLFAVGLLSLLLAAGGAALAWSVGRRLPEGSTEAGEPESSRARFLAWYGAALGVAFVVAILALEVPKAVLGVCQ